jgi:hypothetical protein
MVSFKEHFTGIQDKVRETPPKAFVQDFIEPRLYEYNNLERVVVNEGSLVFSPVPDTFKFTDLDVVGKNIKAYYDSVGLDVGISKFYNIEYVMTYPNTMLYRFQLDVFPKNLNAGVSMYVLADMNTLYRIAPRPVVDFTFNATNGQVDNRYYILNKFHLLDPFLTTGNEHLYETKS